MSESQGVISPEEAVAITRELVADGELRQVDPPEWYDLLTLEAAVGEATDEVLSLLDTDATDEEVRATVEHLYGPFRGMQLSDDLEGYEELRFLLKELNGLLGRVERLDEEEA